ncbi:sulfurtransferase TusA family protein [Isoptericola sp. b441]|uniref:Sulfurtransferase TusA family protein n=1 Tax=Actinotalea lenta TaxID=3064654 RepID=A0ABT9DC73_9CELL|nr:MULTISPECIES: sulfurtransferase TusA family protein [unclassified Isoptericola]MDO8108467.1 sulfurtransferase TusA family protein [Isoptericola sp. b441]MDO8119886.1 sulfurtransferase TusA family protein [Isoptericola sp. b490]
MAARASRLKALECVAVVDTRGRRRPGPVLAVKRSIPQAPRGGVLEVLATDRSTLAELPSWTAKVGHEYLGAFEDDGDLHLFVRRLD